MASIIFVYEWHGTLWINVRETFTLPYAHQRVKRFRFACTAMRNEWAMAAGADKPLSKSKVVGLINVVFTATGPCHRLWPTGPLSPI